MSNVNKKEITWLDANNFVSTPESRKNLLSILNPREQKMFKVFVKSVLGWY